MPEPPIASRAYTIFSATHSCQESAISKTHRGSAAGMEDFRNKVADVHIKPHY